MRVPFCIALVLHLATLSANAASSGSHGRHEDMRFLPVEERPLPAPPHAYFYPHSSGASDETALTHGVGSSAEHDLVDGQQLPGEEHDLQRNRRLSLRDWWARKMEDPEYIRTKREDQRARFFQRMSECKVVWRSLAFGVVMSSSL